VRVSVTGGYGQRRLALLRRFDWFNVVEFAPGETTKNVSRHFPLPNVNEPDETTS